MFWHPFVYIIIFLFQVILAAPFSEQKDNNEVDVPPTSYKPLQWTDINYDDNVNNGPEYIEYDEDDLLAEKKTTEGIEETIRNDSEHNLNFKNEQNKPNTKDSLLPFLSPDGNMGVNKNVITRNNGIVSSTESDDTDQQINDDKTLITVTDINNNKTLDGEDQGNHNLLNKYKLLENETTQESDNLNQEANIQEKNTPSVNMEGMRLIPPQASIQMEHPTEQAILVKENITKSLIMKHNSVVPTATIRSKPTQPPHYKSTINHNKKKPVRNTHNSSTKNSKSIKQGETLPRVQQPQDKVKMTSKVKGKNEISNKDSIQVQIAKVERLLREIEAKHNSDYEIYNDLEEDSNSVPHHNEIMNYDADDIFREGDTQPLHLTHNTQDSQQSDKVIEALNTLTQENALASNDLLNQPLIDTIFKLVQPKLSSLVIPTASTTEKHIPTISKSRNSNSETVAQQLGNEDGTGTFDSSKKIKLPNGNWTPSCKNVTKGKYCMEPDGEDQAIIECSGENVGFQFSCGGTMMCYSVGPHDVDCQNKK